MIEEINKKYKKYIIQPWGSVYIHSSVLKSYIMELITNWYKILWYDWIIFNKQWTLWPLLLIFDFCRKNNSYTEKNKLAIENIDNLIKTARKEWYNLDDLYVDIVFDNK